MMQKGARLLSYEPKKIIGTNEFDASAFSKLLHDRNDGDGLWETDAFIASYNHGIRFRRAGVAEAGKYRPDSTFFSLLEPYVKIHDKIEVFEYGRNGVIIEKQDMADDERWESIRLLPACHEGFYRDWDNDGICVKSVDVTFLTEQDTREVFTIHAVAGSPDNFDEIEDRVTSALYYDRAEAIHYAKEFYHEHKKTHKHLDVSVCFNEFQQPSGDILGEPECLSLKDLGVLIKPPGFGKEGKKN